MNENDRKQVAACGTFHHVTTADGTSGIEESGLDPACDNSQVIRGGRKDQAVYLCPAASIEKVSEILGDREKDQEYLFVYEISASALAKKNCGADVGWLVNIASPDKHTVELSLEHGSIACYEAIARSELRGPKKIRNPSHIGTSGGDEL